MLPTHTAYAINFDKVVSMIPAHDPSVLSRLIKGLRSHLKPVTSLETQMVHKLKRLASIPSLATASHAPKV